MKKRLIAQSTAPLFRDQARLFLQQGTNRKRSPFRPATIKVYKSQIETNLNPNIGNLPLDVIGNKAVKDLAAVLAAKNLKPASIALNINIIKQIRGSAQDNEGAELYPYTWNTEFIDAPEIKDQSAPIASAQAVTDAIKSSDSGLPSLIAVLAGTGLRIGEALALVAHGDERQNNVWDRDKAVIYVRQQRRAEKVGPTKTRAGIREIDLPLELNQFLSFQLMLNDINGFVFPMSENYYRQRLSKCGILGGFHSLRRFRVTHLRLQSVPESLIHFWIGHEDESVTDRYTKVGTEIESRKQWAQKAGLGFNLPEGV
jgi:integrase